MSVQIGDKVLITEETNNSLGYKDGIEFTVIDILEYHHFDCNYVLNAAEFGEDWKQFFGLDELIKL